MPPTSGEFVSTGLPSAPNEAFLSREELAAFRLRPLEVSPPASNAPTEGLSLHNATDSLRYLFIDSLPVAWVLPNRDKLIPGLVRGHYVVQWRTFLGDAVEPPW